MSSSNVVGIFWDLGGFGHSNGHGTFYLSAAHQPAENIRPPREGTCERPGLDIPSQIYKVASDYGCVKEFRAYSEFPAQSSHKGIQLREDLTVSGVTLRDCVHNNRKEVVDKIIIGMCACHNLTLYSPQRHSRYDDVCYGQSSQLKFYNHFDHQRPWLCISYEYSSG